MCNNCNCNNYDKCSIVGYMPPGFCCSYCILYDADHTCLHTKSRQEEKGSIFQKKELKLISATIKEDLLYVIIEQEGREIPLYIDIKKYLES